MDSSRIASFSQGFALLLLAACAGCSSSTGGDTGSSGSSGSGSSGSGSSGSGSSGTGTSSGSGTFKEDAGAMDGGGMTCPVQTSQTVGVQINLNVTWPSTGSINGGMGPYVLWLLSDQTIDGTGKISAVTHTCQLTTPPIQLNATGDVASGCTAGEMCKVGTQSPVSEWAKVTRTTMVTGQLGGWNVGSSISIDQAVTLNGLPPDSMFKDPTTKWPPFSASGIPFGTGFMFTDDQTGDMTPGIAVIPTTTAGYAKIRTGLGTPLKPAVDKIYIASRTQLGMYGVSSSCTEASGTAFVKLIDNHVIGCEIEGMTGPARNDCAPDQSGYIDSNRTVYVPHAATFKQKVLTAGATCTDVVAALP